MLLNFDYVLIWINDDKAERLEVSPSRVMYINVLLNEGRCYAMSFAHDISYSILYCFYIWLLIISAQNVVIWSEDGWITDSDVLS